MKKLITFILIVGVTLSVNAQYNVLTDEATSVEITPDGMTFNRTGSGIASSNTGIGVGVFRNLTVASVINNTAMGYRSAYNFSSGTRNVSFGASAMENFDGDRDNCFFGFQAGRNSSGKQTVGVGYGAALGSKASLTVAIGHFASISDTSLFMKVAIGAKSCTFGTPVSNLVHVGFESGLNSDAARSNVGIGAEALRNSNGSRNNVAVGYNAIRSARETTSYNIAIGHNSLREIGLRESSSNFGQFNIAIGKNTMRFDSTGYDNIAIGKDVLFRFRNGNNNIIAGTQAFRFLMLGNENIGIGYRVGGDRERSGIPSEFGLGTAYKNILIGYRAGRNLGNYPDNSGRLDNVVAVGCEVLSSTRSTDNLTDIVAIGSFAGGGIREGGSNCTFIGALSGLTNAASNMITNSTAIGYRTFVNVSNAIRLGNASVTLIGGYAAFTMASDRRLKKNISYGNAPGLQFIKQLRTANYQYIEANNGVIYNGLIAQDVNEILQAQQQSFSGVRQLENEEKTWQISYEMLTIPLINSTRELHKNISELTASIDTFQPLDISAISTSLKSTLK